MGQLSFYSAEATQPRVEDLAGLLCGPGQVVSFGRTAARLSVVVDEEWRARAIVAACAERDVEAERATSDEGHPLARTAFRTDLIELASSWTRGAVKAVPAGLTLGGAALRMWVLAAGRSHDGGYLLGLDPRAPDTYEPLGGALARCGLAATLVVARGGGPGLRISGRRRLARLAEMVGQPPFPGVDEHWPVELRARASG